MEDLFYKSRGKSQVGGHSNCDPLNFEETPNVLLKLVNKILINTLSTKPHKAFCGMLHDIEVHGVDNVKDKQDSCR